MNIFLYIEQILATLHSTVESIHYTLHLLVEIGFHKWPIFMVLFNAEFEKNIVCVFFRFFSIKGSRTLA